jgi:GT2 family glycosyltransferase
VRDLISPMVSIIWVNYNSMSTFKIVERSLIETFKLNYPPDKFEVIIVDNGSNDGSFERIKKLLENNNFKNYKLIRLDKNYGFSIANNIGFKNRNTNSEYVVLLNNDAIPFRDSLRNLVDFMETHKYVGAAQGINLKPNFEDVDSSGYFIDELLFIHKVFKNINCSSLDKPHIASYVSGAYSIYRVSSLLKLNNEELIFPNLMLFFLDDNFLGIKLWNKGIPVVTIPLCSGIHYGGLTFNKYKIYLYYFGIIAMKTQILLSNSRFRKIRLMRVNVSLLSAILKTLIKENYSSRDVIIAYFMASKMSKRVANILKNKYEFSIDVKKVPILKSSLSDIIKGLIINLYK